MPGFKVTGDKVKTQIALIIEEMQLETDYLLQSIQLDIKKRIFAGATAKEAKQIVLNEFLAGEGPAKAWLNKQNRKLAEMGKDLVAKPSNLHAEKNPNSDFAWVLGSVKTSHCSDCLSLAGKEPRTISEWRDLGYGLPREGRTECNVGCQCLFKEVDKK